MLVCNARAGAQGLAKVSCLVRHGVEESAAGKQLPSAKDM